MSSRESDILLNAMNRRHFLRTTGTITLATAVSSPLSMSAAANAKPATAAHLPRWRGFNLIEKFWKKDEGNPPFQEQDFALMSEWGFNFARLPMSYLCWSDPTDWLKLREDQLKDIDAAVELGRKYGVHINMNFHRAPGYCVGGPKEPFDLWKDEKALEACAFHWAHFARRYKGIPNERVSFDLLNEPTNIGEETYVRVVKRLVQTIRAEDPHRLIIADGLQCGRIPVNGLVDLGIAQSTHWYDPIELTFYKAPWLEESGVKESDKWPVPTWPLNRDGKVASDKATLRKDLLAPWKQLEQKGVGIHVGEFSVYDRTPHAVTLAWMRTCLELFQEAGWGWAAWNLRGDSGMMDSKRADVKYEDFRGHKLDREMLNLLQSH
jgi:endoglucanase